MQRQRIHTNVIGLFRTSLRERHGDYGDAVCDLLPNIGLRNAYNLRAPYSFVRFATLRLFIRVLAKAPLGLLVLLVESIGDAKAWLSGGEDDLRWMVLCDRDRSMHEWVVFCRGMPKRARAVVRKICDSPAARSVV